jgi:hypothetical protein
MKPGARVALGVGIGYFLGRTRKMRLALAFAAAGAGGTLGKSSGALLRGGTSALASSPEVAKLTERVRGELVNAVKAAAVTAASSRIDSLSERIQPGEGEATDEDEETTKSSAHPNAKKSHAEARENNSKPDASEDEKSSVPAPRQHRTRRKAAEDSATDSATESNERPKASTRGGRHPIRRTRR